MASDSLNENYTTVVIHIKDVNDLPPVFNSSVYRRDIAEEFPAPYPLHLMQVRYHYYFYYFPSENIGENVPHEAR